ncbi:MAG: hypothetical protein ACM32O_19620, partial [Clostridia bacterium]
VKSGTYKSAFRKDLTKATSQPIDQWVGVFDIDLATGKKAVKQSLLFFTNDEKKVLVASQVVVNRGDLKKKYAEGTLTIDDVKKTYGEPTRSNESILEYYDFTNKIVMLAGKNDKGAIDFLVTKYDLLYANDPTDLKEHESIIKRLSEEEAAPKK